MSDQVVVSEEDVSHIVASWTGVPVKRLIEAESERLLKLEEILHQRVIGQDEAVTAVSKAVRRAHTGLKDPNRPIGSFIFPRSHGGSQDRTGQSSGRGPF